MSWFTLSWTPLRTESSAVGSFYCVATETTERVLAERALQTNYHTLFEKMTDGFALCELIRDQAGEVVDWLYIDLNPALKRQTGLRRDAVVGRTFREAFPGVDLNPWLRNNRQAVDEQRPVAFEDRWAGR